MLHPGIRFASLFALTVVAGCSADDITDTSNTFVDPAMSAAPPPVLDGAWE